MRGLVVGCCKFGLQKGKFPPFAPTFALMSHHFNTASALDDGIVDSVVMGTIMNQDIRSLSTDELWLLREKIAATLDAKLTAEKETLEKRLWRLRKIGVERAVKGSKRRPYPVVFPKFRNPDDPSETWAGRGKQPRWLRKQLRSGKRMDDFRISASLAA
jgi:DNA-binding protein H-NS